MALLPAASGPNASQSDHWNTVAGPKWVGLSQTLDQHLSEIAKLVMDRAAPQAGESVLEVDCGTGSSAVALAIRVGERGEVLGVDISEVMLSAPRQRIATSGLTNVSVLLADAQTHQFTPKHFDLLFSRFGVMFFDDPVAAFRNIRRAGARLCFACWGRLEENTLVAAIEGSDPPAGTAGTEALARSRPARLQRFRLSARSVGEQWLPRYFHYSRNVSRAWIHA